MRFVSFSDGGRNGLAVVIESRASGWFEGDPDYPGDLLSLIRAGGGAVRAAHEVLAHGPTVDLDHVTFLPPVTGSSKILCVGQNYREHAAEMGHTAPAHPLVFARFASSLVGHGGAILRPHVSMELDYEAEIAAIIGRRGRHITRADALDHVAGYSLFNDGSVRDYQARTSQYTLGKNFDSTGGFGPMFVTAEEVPPGVRGLRLEMRVNGTVMQRASTDDMIFDVPTLVTELSEVMTLEPGDVILTGTPSGVGKARKPPVFLKPGDVCEVEVPELGVLRNPVTQES